MNPVLKIVLLFSLLFSFSGAPVFAEQTWNAQHSIRQIETNLDDLEGAVASATKQTDSVSGFSYKLIRVGKLTSYTLGTIGLLNAGLQSWAGLVGSTGNSEAINLSLKFSSITLGLGMLLSYFDRSREESDSITLTQAQYQSVVDAIRKTKIDVAELKIKLKEATP